MLSRSTFNFGAPKSITTRFRGLIVDPTPRVSSKEHQCSTVAAFSTSRPRAAPGVARVQTPCYFRRLSSTPRGRVYIGGIVLAGLALDYELWTWYQRYHGQRQSYQSDTIATTDAGNGKA